jgi:hypothetical protein
LFRREQRLSLQIGHVSITEAMVHRDRNRRRDMKGANENRMLSDAELDCVSGGAHTGFGVVTDRRIQLAAQMSEIYKSNNPPSFGPIHLLDR